MIVVIISSEILPELIEALIKITKLYILLSWASSV